MKRLIVISLAVLLCTVTFAQRKSYIDSIPVPSGTDTTFTQKFWSPSSFSLHFWYESLNNTNGTLALYGSNFVNDTAAYDLLFIDQANDGTNDNPKTLSDTVWVVWGESFPFRYLILKFTKGANTAGEIFIDGRKQ